MNPTLVRTASAAAVAATLVLSAPGAAQQTATELTPIATVEGITEYRLENGLRVLLFPDPSKPQITVNITYLVGSRHEGYGETGMAHLLEHLLFKGTPGHPDIMQELTERGAQPNGTTSLDRTNYYEIFPASGDNLEWALDLEADRMVNSRVSAEDLDSEMTVVRNEMESGENSPLGMLVQRTVATAYLWHNYGNSTIGARSDVENVPIERLQAFYRKYYQPDNAMLVVAGNFDEQEALDLIVEKFAPIPRPERRGEMVLYPTYTSEPTQDGERSVTLRRVGDVQHAVSVYHMPAGAHPDYAAIDLLAFALGDTPSGRLYEALVETGLATAAVSQARQLREAGQLLQITVVPEESDLREVERIMNETVEGVLTNPITPEEVERGKTAILNRFERAFQSSAGIALQLSEWGAMGDWRLFFLHRDRIEATTADDVNRVAREYLKPSNRTVGLFYPTESPDRAVMPERPDVIAMVSGYEGREAIAEGEAFDPSPTNIDARTRTYTLDNGLDVALLPKETRGDVAIVRLRLHFGDVESVAGRMTAGSLAGSMLMRGTQTKSRQEIQDELDRLQASGSIGGTATMGTGSFQTVRARLPEVIRLMAELAREPAFPASEFELMKEQRITSLEQARSEPQVVAQIALGQAMENLPADHPNRTETIDESLAKLEATTLVDVLAFYDDFWGPQSGNIVVVGDFDEAQVRQVIEETFGDWESPRPFERIATEFYDAPADDIQLETPDKANAFFIAQQNLELRDTDPDYPALVIAGYMIGGGVLNSRLARRIRVEEGLSYAVQGAISGHPIDAAGSFVALAIHAPENVVAVQEAFFEEMERVIAEGFTQQELDAAKQGWLESRQLSRAQDGQLAGQLASNLYFDRTMSFDADIEARVRGLTLGEVNQAVRDWIDVEKITVVKAGDFANKPPIG